MVIIIVAVGAALLVGLMAVLLRRRRQCDAGDSRGTVSLEPAWGAGDEAHVPQSFVNPMYAGAGMRRVDAQARAPDFQRTGHAKTGHISRSAPVYGTPQEAAAVVAGGIIYSIPLDATEA